MAEVVETLLVRMEARMTDFEKQMAKAQKVAASTSTGIAREFNALNSKLSGIFKLTAGITGFAALTQIPGVIKDIVDEASKLVDTADKLGITTEQLQELKFAAGQTGVEFEDLTSGLSFFNKAIGEAARGSGDLLQILEANGIAIRDQAGNMRPQNELLLDYADLVKNAASATDKTTLVTKAFGKANDELINTLSGGRQGLKDYADQAHKTGQVLDDDLLRKTEALGDKFDEVVGAMILGFKGFVLQTVLQTTDAIDKIGKLLPQAQSDAAAAAHNAEIRAAEDAQLIDERANAILITEGKIAAMTEERARLEALIKAIEEGQAGNLEEVQQQLDDINAGLAVQIGLLSRIKEQQPILDAQAAGGEGAPAPGQLLPRLRPKVTVIPDTGADEQKKKFEALRDSLIQQTAALNESTRAQYIANEVAKLGADATEKQRKEIEALAGKYYDLHTAQQAVNQATEFFAQTAFDAFENLISGAESFKDVLADVLKALERAVLQSLLLGQGPLAGLFGTGPTGNSTVGGILGAIASLFMPGKQHGGPVQAGRIYPVGEAGPELFMPNVSGQIIPADKGAGASVIQLHVIPSRYFDATVDQRSTIQAQKVSVEVVRQSGKAQARRQELSG